MGPPMQNDIFETFIYKKCHFRDLPIQKRPIYISVFRLAPSYKNGQNFDPYTKMARIWPPTQIMAEILTPHNKWPKFCQNGENYAKKDEVLTLIFKNGQNFTPPIQKTDKIWPPLCKKCLSFTLLKKLSPLQKMWPPIQKMAFLRPLYNKMNFRDPYTTKWNFRDPHPYKK